MARPAAPDTLRTLRRRRLPTWWSDAKVGIFVHWTPASVAGFAPTDHDVGDLLTSGVADPVAHTPYVEWYENSLRFPDSPVARWHREHQGGRPYVELGEDFRAGLAGWDPTEWARRFAAAGARYMVLVAKHHDGFCLWPSEVANPHRTGWHTGRDVVGELADAVRAEGLRFGLYYSGGLDWTFEARPMGTFADIVAAVPDAEEYRDYAESQVRELIERYRPSVLWNDIAWPFGGRRLWRLFADYYDAVPDGVLNDRWMPRSAAWGALRFAPVRAALDLAAAKASRGGVVPPRPPHFDVRTPEYTTFDSVPADPWECCRGMDRSFGYNRTSLPEHFIDRAELLGSLADIVAKGGNLLLNVGPRGEDATIPEAQLERLGWMGEWLRGAAPAVYGTRPWVRAEGTSVEGHRLRFSARDDAVHVFVLDGPAGPVTIEGLGVPDAVDHRTTVVATATLDEVVDPASPVVLSFPSARATPPAPLAVL